MDHGRPSKQNGESFLREMPVVRQDFGDALLPHRLHRNAVGQAVSLVGAGLVEGKTVKEGLMGLRADDDAGVGQNPFGIAGGSLAASCGPGR